MITAWVVVEKKRVVCGFCHPEFFFEVRVIDSKLVDICFWFTIQRFHDFENAIKFYLEEWLDVEVPINI